MCCQAPGAPFAQCRRHDIDVEAGSRQAAEHECAWHEIKVSAISGWCADPDQPDSEQCIVYEAYECGGEARRPSLLPLRRHRCGWDIAVSTLEHFAASAVGLIGAATCLEPGGSVTAGDVLIDQLVADDDGDAAEQDGNDIDGALKPGLGCL